MPVPILQSSFQKRVLAAQSQASSSQCESQSSFSSSFAAASQFDASQRDFSPPHPVTLPSSEPAPPERGRAPTPAAAEAGAWPAVSPHSAAAAAGLVVRPFAPTAASASTQSNSASSSSGSPSAALLPKSHAETVRQPVPAPRLPSPPPFVSKYKNRQRASQAETASQRTQPDASFSQHSSTSPPRPMLTTSQLQHDDTGPQTTYDAQPQRSQPPASAQHGVVAFDSTHLATDQQPRPPLSTSHSIPPPPQAAFIAQADGGYTLQHTAPQLAVAGAQIGPFDSKPFGAHHMPFTALYPPAYSQFYPPMPPTQSYATMFPLTTQPTKRRRRPRSPALADGASSSSEDSLQATGAHSPADAYSSHVLKRRTRWSAGDVAQYKTVYRQHKTLLLTQPPQADLAATLNRELRRPAVMQVSSQPAHLHSVRQLLNTLLIPCRCCVALCSDHRCSRVQPEEGGEEDCADQCTRAVDRARPHQKAVAA